MHGKAFVFLTKPFSFMQNLASPVCVCVCVYVRVHTHVCARVHKCSQTLK